jgi:hypothetical protein
LQFVPRGGQDRPGNASQVKLPCALAAEGLHEDLEGSSVHFQNFVEQAQLSGGGEDSLPAVLGEGC